MRARKISQLIKISKFITSENTARDYIDILNGYKPLNGLHAYEYELNVAVEW